MENGEGTVSKHGGTKRKQQLEKWSQSDSTWSFRNESVMSRCNQNVKWQKQKKIKVHVKILKCEMKTLQKENKRLRSGKNVRGSSFKPWQSYSRQLGATLRKDYQMRSNVHSPAVAPNTLNLSLLN